MNTDSPVSLHTSLGASHAGDAAFLPADLLQSRSCSVFHIEHGIMQTILSARTWSRELALLGSVFQADL